MSWASAAIQRLQAGETVSIRPRGQSMAGKVNSGDLVTLVPCDPAQLKAGDVVLVKVKGRVYLHLVKAINNGRWLIGNNWGGINGWVGSSAIYGVMIAVEP